MLDLESYEGEPITIELPTTVDLEVTDTGPGFAGDTATNATKAATVSTGAQVQVPLFVNVGDKIRVDTRTGEYLTASRRRTNCQGPGVCSLQVAWYNCHVREPVPS